MARKCKCNQAAGCRDGMNTKTSAACLKTLNGFCSHTLCQHSTPKWRQIYETEIHFPDDILSFSLHMAALPINLIINMHRQYTLTRSFTLCPAGNCLRTHEKDEMAIFTCRHSSSEVYIKIILQVGQRKECVEQCRHDAQTIIGVICVSGRGYF